MEPKVKVTRIRDEYHRKLQELATIIQQERGLRRPDLGIAAETAIAEALEARKAKPKDKSKKM